MCFLKGSSPTMQEAGRKYRRESTKQMCYEDRVIASLNKTLGGLSNTPFEGFKKSSRNLVLPKHRPFTFDSVCDVVTCW